MVQNYILIYTFKKKINREWKNSLQTELYNESVCK